MTPEYWRTGAIAINDKGATSRSFISSPAPGLPAHGSLGDSPPRQ